MVARAVVPCGFFTLKFTSFRWEELICWETKLVEKIARTALCCCYALVLWDAIVDYRDKKLCLSFKTYDGKQTKCYIYTSAALRVDNNIVKHSAHIVRDACNVYFAAAATVIAAIYNFCSKADGVNNFCVCQLFLKEGFVVPLRIGYR